MVWINARKHYRREISACSEAQRYMMLLELHDSDKAETLVNKLINQNQLTADDIINEIKKELEC